MPIYKPEKRRASSSLSSPDNNSIYPSDSGTMLDYRHDLGHLPSNNPSIFLNNC